MIKKCFIIMLLWSSSVQVTHSQVLTIEECYDLAKENYPAIQKMDLIAKTAEYNVKNANKKFLPQLDFTGQASYQSETVGFADITGPDGTSLPSLSKDQYKLQGEISQLIYDGGSNKSEKDLIKANSELAGQNLESNLYAIKSRINNIYFSVLLMDAQLQQNELNKANIQAQVDKTEEAYKNGTAFKSNVEELKAEIINIEMAGTEYQANRTAYLKVLSLFIGQELDATTALAIPSTAPAGYSINRPELKAFDIQHSIYDVQKKALKSSYLPTVSAFFQGGYGRPTLNIIENKFGPWYMAGVRMNWSLGGLYTKSNKKRALELDQKSIEVDKETFLFNTQMDLVQEDENVKKYAALVIKDEEAIALRESVTKSAIAQLDNGVITTHEYIQKANAESLAKQGKILHEIQLLQAKYNKKYLSGN